MTGVDMNLPYPVRFDRACGPARNLASRFATLVKRLAAASATMDARSLLIDITPFLSPRPALDGLAAELADRRVDGAPHTIAEIVAHLVFWQGWFAGRCDGSSGPMPRAAAIGWPTPAPGRWNSVRCAVPRRARPPRRARRGRRPGAPHRPADRVPTARRTTPSARSSIHVGAHNAHHLGQVVLLRQVLGAWPPPAGSYTW